MVTDYEKKILAHGIIEVDEWIARTEGDRYESEIKYQLDRNRPLYEAEKNDPGYKTAAQKAAALVAAPITDIQRIDAAFVQTDIGRVIFEAFYILNNDVRTLKGQPTITRQQLKDWFITKLNI